MLPKGFSPALILLLCFAFCIPNFLFALVKNAILGLFVLTMRTTYILLDIFHCSKFNFFLFLSNCFLNNERLIQIFYLYNFACIIRLNITVVIDLYNKSVLPGS